MPLALQALFGVHQGEPTPEAGSDEACKYGLKMLRRVLHTENGRVTTAATMACAANLGHPCAEVSHDMVAINPHLYGVPVPDEIEDAAAEPDDGDFEAANVTINASGQIYVARGTDDYRHRGARLRTVNYLPGGPFYATEPRVEFSPYMVASHYERKKTKSGEAVPFQNGHPLASTHRLARRPRQARPYFVAAVPQRPDAQAADDAEGVNEDRRAYASFALGHFRDGDILRRHLNACVAAGGLPDWWAFFRAWEATADPNGSPAQQYAHDCMRTLATIDTGVVASKNRSQPFCIRREEVRASAARVAKVCKRARACL